MVTSLPRVLSVEEFRVKELVDGGMDLEPLHVSSSIGIGLKMSFGRLLNREVGKFLLQ